MLKVSNTNHQFNLIQQFYIIGINHKDSIPISKVLSKYPQQDLPYLSIQDDIVINHCFPYGVPIRETPFKPEMVFFQLDNFSTTSNDYSKIIYFACYIFNDCYTKKLNVQKAIVISSFLPFYDQFESLLFTFQSVIMSNKLTIPIESAIHNFVFGIPSPPPGLYSIHYKFFEYFSVDFRQECINKIPYSPVDLKVLVNHFSIQAIMQLVKLVLLEKPIFIFCENKYNLCTLVQGLQSIILPFKTVGPVISILPVAYYTLVEYLDKFIIGISKKYTTNFFDNSKINIKNKEVIVVEIDYNNSENSKVSKIHLISKDSVITSLSIDELPRTLYEHQQDIDSSRSNILKDISLPYYYTNKLYNTMNNYLYEKNGRKKTNAEINNVELKFMFYYYFVAVLLHYRAYVIMDEKYLIDLYPKIANKTYKVKDIFKVDEFMLTLDPRDQVFFNNFFDTEIWKNFLIRAIYPRSISDKMELLLFDEMIKMKKNRKIKTIIKNATPLLNSVLFEQKKLISVSCDEGNKKRSATVGTTPKIAKRNSLHQMKVFPLLSNEYFKSIKTSDTIYKYYEEYECQCYHLLLNSKYKEFFNGNDILCLHKKLRFSLKTYIYKLWFKLFAISFWYVDKKERWKRFQDCINVINKVPNELSDEVLDKDTTYSLTLCLMNYGDKEMIATLFTNLKYRNYTILTQLNSKLAQCQKEEYPQYDFLKKRNLNIISQKNVSDLNYKLDLTDICEKCKREIGFSKKLIESDIAEHEFFSFYCDKCKKYQKAIATASLGETKVKFNLYSPWYIIKQFKYQNKLDIKNFYKESKYIWCIILYFQLHKLNFDFLLPYQSEEGLNIYTSESLKQSRNIEYEYKAVVQMKKYFESFCGSENYNMSNTISFNSSKKFREKKKMSYKDSYSYDVSSRKAKRAYSFEQNI